MLSLFFELFKLECQLVFMHASNTFQKAELFLVSNGESVAFFSAADVNLLLVLATKNI
jgi:hypothetical protein